MAVDDSPRARRARDPCPRLGFFGSHPAGGKRDAVESQGLRQQRPTACPRAGGRSLERASGSTGAPQRTSPASARPPPPDDFPWFRRAPVAAILRLERPARGHIRWPELDVDL